MTGWISEVFVADELRGAGVGRLLIDAANAWYRGERITRVELQVVVGNARGRRFYEQLGWREELVQLVWIDGAPMTPDQ